VIARQVSDGEVPLGDECAGRHVRNAVVTQVKHHHLVGDVEGVELLELVFAEVQEREGSTSLTSVIANTVQSITM
jgi:hypothetical protein